jgi:hypothetical protein
MRPVLAQEAQVSMPGSLRWSAFQAPVKTALASMAIQEHKYAPQMVLVSIIVFVKKRPRCARPAPLFRAVVLMEIPVIRSAAKTDKPTIHVHAVRLPRYVRPEQRRPVSVQMVALALNRAKMMA